MYNFTNIHSEFRKREITIKNKRKSRKNKAEAYLLHKLNFILEQKREEFLNNLQKLNFYKRKRSTGSSIDLSSELVSRSKNRSKEESKSIEESNYKGESDRRSEHSSLYRKSKDSEDMFGHFEDVDDLDPDAFDQTRIIKNGKVKV